MKFAVRSLIIALINVGQNYNLDQRVTEAARLYKNGAVDKIFLHHPNFHSNPGQLFTVHLACMAQGIPGENLIIDEPDLASFIEKSEEGIHRLVIITTRLKFVAEWYKFKKMPGWIWEPIRFHIVGAA